ncbi:MAG: ferric reductase-like transmembrane domain-containing protein [Boseongicola sp.]|nr:ferric reductase-like transmembrane domain-containing protein [Boseongicola sp.]
MRHLVVLVIACAGSYAFLESRPEWSEMHRWNRAVGDMSLVLIAISMAIGPTARLTQRFRFIVPWRRETGIYGVLFAVVHTAIILIGWVDWDMIRLFGFEIHPNRGIYVMVQHGFGLANSIGILALIYGVVLACSSNDLSQKVLGGTVWKFLQQSSYVLWMLVIVHTAYFLFLHFLHFHQKLPDPNWAQWPFGFLVGTVALLQTAAFLKIWRERRLKPQSGGSV